MSDIKLTPTQRAFLEAVQRGDAVQLRRSNPYRTVVKGSDRAVPKTAIAAVRDFIRIDLDGGTTWEKPWRLTQAGEKYLAKLGADT